MIVDLIVLAVIAAAALTFVAVAVTHARARRRRAEHRAAIDEITARSQLHPLGNVDRYTERKGW